MFICSFASPAEDLKKKDRSVANVVEILRTRPKISCFTFSENIWLWKLIEQAKREGLITEVEEPYPWHKFKVL